MTDVLVFPSHMLPPFRVFESDAFHPPVPPPGAHAVEVRDARGRIISFGWTDPAVDKDLVIARAWSWSERLAPLLARHGVAG